MNFILYLFPLNVTHWTHNSTNIFNFVLHPVGEIKQDWVDQTTRVVFVICKHLYYVYLYINIFML